MTDQDSIRVRTFEDGTQWPTYKPSPVLLLWDEATQKPIEWEPEGATP